MLAHWRQRHVIQFSDRIPLDRVGEYLAHEVRVLFEVRGRAVIGHSPGQPLLQPGPLSLGVLPRLSADDRGLLDRIELLADQIVDHPRKAATCRPDSWPPHSG